MVKFLSFGRVGFIFTVEIGGLQTFGRERQMVKGASIQSLAMSSSAILKMDGDMATSCVSMLMEKGMYTACCHKAFNPFFFRKLFIICFIH